MLLKGFKFLSGLSKEDIDSEIIGVAIGHYNKDKQEHNVQTIDDIYLFEYDEETTQITFMFNTPKHILDVPKDLITNSNGIIPGESNMELIFESN